MYRKVESMVTITVDPGEQFAHSHTVETTTELIAGEATLRMQGKEIKLSVNKPVTVPAHTEHVVIANGHEPARLKCGLCWNASTS